MNPKTFHKLYSCFSILAFTISVIMVVVLIFSTAGHITDSDAASELILSRNLAKDGNLSLLSHDWYYSTEIRVLNTQIVYAFLFHLWDNFLFVRIAGALILTAILVLSFLFFCKSTGLSTQSFFLGAAMLLCPISIPYARIVLMHNYYIPHLAIRFFILALFASSLNRTSFSRKNLFIKEFLLLGLCFVSGLGGIRQLLITVLPLFACSFTLLLFATTSNPTSNVHQEKKGFFLSLFCGITALLGFLFYHAVLQQNYSLGGIAPLVTQIPSINAFHNLFSFWLELSGFRSNIAIFSLTGIISLSALALWAIYIFSTYSSAKITFTTKQSYSAKMSLLFFPFLLLVNTAACLFSSFGMRFVLYQIPVFSMVFPMMLSMAKVTLKNNRFFRLIILAVVIIALLNGAVTTKYLANPSGAIPYTGLAYTNYQVATQLSGAIDYLNEHQLYVGYATFWNANVLTEISNGQIEAVPVKTNSLTAYLWLTSNSIIEKAQQQKEVFLLLTLAEEEHFPIIKEQIPNALEVFRDKHYIIYTMKEEDIWGIVQ